MVLPGVASVSVTDCVPVYVLPAGLNIGALACCCCAPVLTKDQSSIFWLDVRPPVPPVKPTYAVFAPTIEGMLIVQLVEKVPPVTPSVIVMVSVVPL